MDRYPRSTLRSALPSVLLGVGVGAAAAAYWLAAEPGSTEQAQQQIVDLERRLDALQVELVVAKEQASADRAALAAAELVAPAADAEASRPEAAEESDGPELFVYEATDPEIVEALRAQAETRRVAAWQAHVVVSRSRAVLAAAEEAMRLARKGFAGRLEAKQKLAVHYRAAIDSAPAEVKAALGEIYEMAQAEGNEPGSVSKEELQAAGDRLEQALSSLR